MSATSDAIPRTMRATRGDREMNRFTANLPVARHELSKASMPQLKYRHLGPKP